jgi:hypothetical protein
VKSTIRVRAAALIALAFVACQPGTNTHPVPSVAQIGSDLHCTTGDHGFEDSQAGWGFCYPGTWKYTERSQTSATPPGLDLTFDITDVQCTAASGPSARPSCAPNAGLFAFMIISTYERGSAANLSSWLQANLTPPQTSPSPLPSSIPQASPSPVPSPTPLTLTPIQWGNSTEAGTLPDGRRVAMTQHHVVILDIRSGQGLLDLDAQMGSRLNTWKFTY